MLKDKRMMKPDLRPGGENSFFNMKAPLVLPPTNFTLSPNTPTVANPAESALAAISKATSVEKSAPMPWGTILISCLIGAAVAYYALKEN